MLPGMLGTDTVLMERIIWAYCFTLKTIRIYLCQIVNQVNAVDTSNSESLQCCTVEVLSEEFCFEM